MLCDGGSRFRRRLGATSRGRQAGWRGAGREERGREKQLTNPACFPRRVHKVDGKQLLGLAGSNMHATTGGRNNRTEGRTGGQTDRQGGKTAPEVAPAQQTGIKKG